MAGNKGVKDTDGGKSTGPNADTLKLGTDSEKSAEEERECVTPKELAKEQRCGATKESAPTTEEKYATDTVTSMESAFQSTEP